VRFAPIFSGHPWARLDVSTLQRPTGEREDPSVASRRRAQTLGTDAPILAARLLRDCDVVVLVEFHSNETLPAARTLLAALNPDTR